MKAKVIFFGASLAGLQAFESLKDKVDILAFADNDLKKQGSNIKGIPIISPGAINDIEYDGIFISSMYVVEIYNQLIGMGVPKDKVVTEWSASLTPKPKFPWDAVITLFVIVLAVMFIVGHF
ncbi:nucleoside-diphosphate sugar epimerase/dehydratase [Thalassotalea marina]|uniref:Uncharacterized protein n=1 Tax=Thalassotalea marina TaxID=1673741 RepID=A0A919BBB8_9GAMM|nr:hypothetical protein [Thalassotalea marina]GHF80497.1 hypothetical protein GCM10017161_04740 [Thalassotalea marina]